MPRRPSPALTAALVVGMLAAGNAAVLAGTDASPLRWGEMRPDAAAAQYGGDPASPPGCARRLAAHDQAVTKLVVDQRTARAALVRANAARVRAARKAGVSGRRLRRIRRSNAARLARVTKGQAVALTRLKASNRLDERGRGCRRPD